MAADNAMPILIVDDYKTMIRIIRNLLKQLGFEDVDEAADGKEALGKLREKKYGLVISDWNMEPMTGYELLREVRGDPNTIAYAIHHGHRRIQNRKRGCGEKGRREQLHRQAVQRCHAEEQDRFRLRRLTSSTSCKSAMSNSPRIDNEQRTPQNRGLHRCAPPRDRGAAGE